MMRAAVAGLLLASAALAPPAAALEEWTIDAGTVGLLVEDHRAPLLFVSVEFGAGSWSPWVEEHDAGTAFEIQMHDPQGELRRRADLLAASISLTVGSRASTLWLACRPEDAPQALDLVRAILANRDFDGAELRRRRRARKIAWETSLREPQFVLGQATARALFREDDPRRRPWEEPRPGTADAGKLAAARDVLIRLPGRVAGFAGAVTLDEAKRLAARLLPEVAPGTPPDLAPRLGPVTPPERRPPLLTVRLPRLTQAYLAYGRASLGWLDPDYPASLIADHALGGHFNSRLMVALRQEGGDTYGAGVRAQGDVEPGAYGLFSFTRIENAAALERKLREVLATFHAGGISEAERALAAGNLVGRRAFERESPASILRVAMQERRFGLPHGFFDLQAERAAALSLDDVNAFVRRFHDPRGFTMLVLRAE